MPSTSIVEAADRKSRQRAIVFVFATVVFALVQIVVHPAFNNEEYQHGWRAYSWAFNEALLLLCLSAGSGLWNSSQFRALMNDEVAQRNYREACTGGFWCAAWSGLILYVVPSMQKLSGHQALYLVVTLSTVTAMLKFSWMEFRAHADA